jgi:hypothetical protein
MGDYVKVAEVKDIQPSTMKAVEVNGKKVVLPMSKENIMRSATFVLILMCL